MFIIAAQFPNNKYIMCKLTYLHGPKQSLIVKRIMMHPMVKYINIHIKNQLSYGNTILYKLKYSVRLSWQVAKNKNTQYFDFVSNRVFGTSDVSVFLA